MNIRLTKKRALILEALKSHHGTLSAAEIHARVPSVDLVTIYRSLELFTREKIIKQLHLNTGEALYEHQAEPHHHAVCSDCERVIHFTAPDAKIKKLLGLTDFEVDEIEVTVKGHCSPNRT